MDAYISQFCLEKLCRAILVFPLPSPRHNAAEERTDNRTCLYGHSNASRPKGLPWTQAEHVRYLQQLTVHPRPSWKEIAAYIGTRTERQVLCHHQKYQEKLRRHARGLRTPGRKGSKLTIVAYELSPAPKPHEQSDSDTRPPVEIDSSTRLVLASPTRVSSSRVIQSIQSPPNDLAGETAEDPITSTTTRPEPIETPKLLQEALYKADSMAGDAIDEWSTVEYEWRRSMPEQQVTLVSLPPRLSLVSPTLEDLIYDLTRYALPIDSMEPPTTTQYLRIVVCRPPLSWQAIVSTWLRMRSLHQKIKAKQRRHTRRWLKDGRLRQHHQEVEQEPRFVQLEDEE